ncbi:DUF4347 domain-containing protein [Azospirillum brasilense]|nr:DUF4347 domain-containing protein [Azospirillum brasilense]
MALEPRFMFDAAGAATAAEVHHQPDQPAPGDKGAGKATDADKLADWAVKESTVPAAASPPAASAPSLTEPAAVTARLAGLQGPARSVVFVDTSVSDYQTLLKDIAPDAKVVLLDPQQEALGQMAKALSGMSGLDSVQVVSHGNEGHLYIAGRAYWADGLANRAQDLQAIGAALKPGGDLLFYACNVGAGQAGQEFVQTIHRLTGADVAVSSDETGNAAGQNWSLEVQSGAIEAATPFARASMETFSGRLGTVVVTSATGTTAGSLNHAITNAAAGDVIEFSSTLVSSKISLGVTTSLLTAAAQNFTINGDVDGDGIADITISGANTGTVPATTDYRGILFNAAGKTLTVKNVIMERFYSGSALQGPLTVQNGSLEVDGATFKDNLNNVIVTTTASTSVTIKNSVFRDNTGVVVGTAGFAVVRTQVNDTLTIENSLFADNSYVMNMGSNSALYPGSIIAQTHNTAAYTVNIRNVTIVNNSYVNNDAGATSVKTSGIGTYSGASATVNVYNTIIAGNSGSLGGTSFADPNAIIYNSDKITLNAGNNYQGAITGNAIFVDSTNATKSLRDYRPASTATTFINAGDSSNANRYGGSYDIRGIDRIRDGALDLGAYEVHWNAGDPTVDLNGAGAGTGESVSTSTPASGVLIAPNAVLAQTDSDTRLLGATIALSGTSDGGAEVLSMLAASVATAKTYGISVTGNDTSTITLRGAASVAGYQAVIQLIQYKNTAGSATAGTRTATVTVNDGETTSTARTSSITLGGGSPSNGAPVNSVVPNVSGTATVGNALSGGTGTWTDPDGDSLTYTYQWYRADDTNGTNAASISGATSASYTLTTSDAHKYLRVAVIANDGNSNATTAYSAYTEITNSTPVNSVVPSVSGTATVGNALSTTNGTWSDADGDNQTYTYQWYRADDTNGTNAASISGATSSSYTLAAGDLNKYLRVVVTANDGKGGTQTATSVYSSQVTAAGNGAPVNTVVPTVSGTATVGNALTRGNGTWTDPDGDSLTYTYQWYRADDTNGTNAASISGATGASYTLTTSDAHKYLRVAVIANDGNSNATTAYSAYTEITNSTPVNSAVPSVSGTATVGNALSTTNGTWSDADGDNQTYTYQWYRADDTNGTNAASISGATSSSYTLAAGDLNKYLRVVVTANDGKGGTQTATSVYSSQVTAAGNGAPVNTVAPTVSGTATVGNALTRGNGTWTDPDGDSLTYTYQWYRADDTNGTNAASISGATGASYTLTTSDAHKYLRVAVVANDGNSNTTTAYSTYTAILNSAPVNSAVPSVSGTATVGNALSTTNGTWSDADGDGRSFTYQWYRADDTNGTNAASISGATSSNYTLTTSDAHKYLRVVVMANDGKGGTQTATSAYTEITNSAPVNSAVPSVSGTATVGNALSTTNGTWSDADGDNQTYTYQWYRADDTNGTNAASISGATSSSYTLAAGDLNKYLRVVVTANDGKGGTQTATSVYSSQVTAAGNGAPVNTVAPTVSGTATVGNALTRGNGTWTDPDGDSLTYTYQWYRADDTNGTNAASISGATGASYTLTTSDAHKYLRVAVIANDGNSNTTTAYSAYTAITNSAPVNSVVPSVSGTATVGNALSTTNGTWSDADGDGRSFTYQWYRADDTNGTNAASISGATSSNYTLTTSDAHKYLRVVVTANDGKGGTQTATSAYTEITNSAPVNSAVPSVSGTATVGNALSTTNGTWSDADGDGRSFTYQWYRADDTNGTNAASISGATSSNYTLTTSDAHKYLRVVVTANDGKGGTQTATSAYTEITNSAPVNSAVPNVSGTATVGNALSTTNGTWSDADGDGRSFTYQWYRADDTNGTNAASISGATSSNYTLTTSDAHKYLRVVVTANDGKGGTQTATSAYTEITNSVPVNSAVPSVSGTATVGNALSTTNGTWSDADGDGRSFTYQWYRADDTNGTNAASISGATSSNYTLTTSDAHKYLRVVVTANDGKGGTQTAPSTYTAILNSAPVLSTDARSLTTIDEDATGNNGDTVASILASAGTATDVDGNALGIAITATDTANGTWQYKTGAGSWTAITGVSGTSALLLASTDRVRFVPNTDYNGSVANGITFKAWDQTSGTAGTTVGNDTTANGGQGAGRQFSTNSATAGLAVSAVNDAPVLTDTVLTLPSVAQAAGAPNGAVGVAVSSLVALGANVTDVDSGAVTGIALVGVDVSEGGTWFYSTDGGSSWTAVGTVNDSGNALLLRTTDRLYYQPTGANAGILSAAITFRAWDRSSGTAGTKVATAGGGGTSAFSTATDTASLAITPAALANTLSLAPGSDTGISNSDNITKASSVTFDGSGANANTTVRLYANGSLLATATADASGVYSFTGVDVSGFNGAVDFTVRQAIAGMESTDSATRTVTFDRTAPTVAITAVTGDNVLNAAESAVPQTVAGTTTGVEDGQTVTVTLNGKTYSATVTNNAWSLAIPSADLQGLTDGGTYAITADLTDVAGNAAVQATRSILVDRTTPLLAIATVAGDNVLNAADSAVGQTVSGVTNGVEDGQTVTVTLNGKTYSTTVTSNRWSLTVPSADLLALTDGASYTITASLSDSAGNPIQATRNVSVDRTPPSVVSVTPPPARTYLPGDTVSFFVQLSEASIINGGAPVLELAVGSEIRNAAYNAAGSTATLLRFDYVVPVGDRAPQGIAVLGLALNGSIVTDAAQGPLVTTLKGVGDTSQVRIDTPIPAKPVGTALSGLSDSGASATDRLTNVTRPTLSGTAEPNATVTVLVDGKAVGTTVADENGFWVHRLQTALTDGTHNVTTTATNRFGIVSDPSDALVVVIDTAVPVTPAPSVTSATVAGATAGERISGIATPTLAGTTEAGSTVSLLVDGKVAGTAVADANGAWTFQFTAALADGTHSLQVQATDRAGNVSSLSAATTLTIDTTPPAAPTVTLNTTAGSTPVVQGTAEANSLISVTINGQAVGTARAGATGSWQLALAADLSVGSYVISAKASDAVGNTGNAGTTTYSVAPPPPPPVVVVAASTGNTTTAASSSNSAVGAATGTGVTQTTGPTLGTAPTLPGLQTSSDAGRVITSSSISSGGAAGNGNSSTDAGRSITIGAIGNSTSSDAGRSITISAMGGAPSGGGTASSSSGVLGGGTGGASNSGLSGVVSGGGGLGGALGGGVGGGSTLGGSSLGGSGLGNSGLGGAAAGGLGAGPGAGSGGAFGGPAGGVSGAGLGTGGPAPGGPAAGGAATGAGTGNGGLNGGVGQGGVGGPGSAAGAASGGAPGGPAAPGGPGTAAGGLGSAPGNRPGGQTGPSSTIENAPGNRPANSAAPQGRSQGQGQPQGQPPAGDAPSGGDPGSAPPAPDGQAPAPGPRADLDGTSLARPAFSRQVAQIHGAADAQSAALLAALTTHVPPGSRAA